MRICLKAAIAFKNSRLGTPIVIGNEKRVKEQLKEIGLDENYKIKIVNSTDKEKERYIQKIYTINFKGKVYWKEMPID